MLTRGIAGLLKKNKVDAYPGHGRLLADLQVEVTAHGSSKKEQLKANNIIVATGSAPIDIPVAKVDGNAIVDNEGALAFSEVPKRLGVIGAGVIGLELGSVWNRLGSEVIILEALEDFLATADRDIAKDAQKVFKKQGLDVRLGAKVTGAKAGKTGVKVSFEDKDGEQSLEVDKLVVAVGRRAYTAELGAEEAGLKVDDRGRIEVDGQCRTGVQGIFAIGDVVTGPMLAHKASEEGVAVAELIAGQSAHVEHDIIPWVIYTHPEIAWVGKTEAELKADGNEFRIGSFPYRAIGRASPNRNQTGSSVCISSVRRPPSSSPKR
jgi:dihydrolipoamide dehydrogenase